MNPNINSGAIEHVAHVKTEKDLAFLVAHVSTFYYASPKTLRRFARKAAARFTELTPK